MPPEVAEPPVEQELSPEQTTEATNALFDKLLGPDDGTAPPPEPEKPTSEVPPQKPVKEAPKKEEAPVPILEEKPTTETVEEPEEEKPKNLTGRAGEAWERKNATIKSLKAEKQTLEQQVKEVESRYAGYLPPDQAKDLQKRLQDAEDKAAAQESVIYKIRHEMHPKYKETISGPLEAATAKAKGIAERNNLNPADVMNAIADPSGTRLDEMISTLTERDKVAILGLAERYQDIMETKKARDEKAADELRQWEEEGRQYDEQQFAQQRQQRERDIEDRMPNVEKRFTSFAESEEEKTTLKTAIEIARQDKLWEKPASVQAAAAVALAMAPFHMKKITSLKDENAALKQQLSGYRASDPAAGKNLVPAPSLQTVTDDDENDTDIVGRIKRGATPIGSR